MRVVSDQAPSLPRQITLLALNLRMTRPERTAIREAQATDEDVADIFHLFSIARFIDLERPETIGGLQVLEAKDLLAPGRAAEILSGEVQPHERP